MNKIRIILISFILFTIFIVGKVYANTSSLRGKTIYLDPGHGGIDAGTTYKNIYEKDLNLLLSKKLKESLEKRGATVLLTRETDKDLSLSNRNRKRSDLISRAYLINKTKPNMYLSIHINHLSNTKYKGLQIFYNKKNKENENIATKLTQFIRSKTYNVRDPKYNNTYYMYKNITEPGVLIELGFLSNPDDRYRLTHEKYQDKLIEYITYALEEYFKEKR